MLNLRLMDLGERRIVEELLAPRYQLKGAKYFGNDCAFVQLDQESNDVDLVATTDPCPEPMASMLGFGDQYFRGWLLATINLSDLAASGATPRGLLTSLILPQETSVSDLTRLLDGIDDCCEKCSTKVLGGNLKEGPKIDLSATAIGTCKRGQMVTRTGSKPRDLVVVLGDLGLFWAGVLARKKQISLQSKEEELLLKNVLTPMPKVSVSQALANRRTLNACIDNSDGLYPSFLQLANANGLRFEIDFSDVHILPEVRNVARHLGIDEVRLFVGWGDWQLIGTVEKSKLHDLQLIADDFQIPLHVVGSVVPGTGVFLRHGQDFGRMIPLDSERFTGESWFTTGIETYISSLLSLPLTS